MKTIKIFFAAIAAALLATSCMDGGYDDMSNVEASAVYGNPNLVETNVVKIADLKAKYRALSQYRDTATVREPMQVKLRVTANDMGGNIYNYISCIDEAGDAILIYIYAGGLYSYLPVGQEILVELNGLCLGTNGNQPCISTLYKTSSGNVYPKNMPFYMWQQHVKLLGCDASKAQPKKYTAADFKALWQSDPDKLAGQVVTLTDVEMAAADGVKGWAPEADLADVNDFNVEREIKGLPKSSIFVCTSTSAKFANDPMPKGKINLTALVLRYGDKAQLTLRSADDAK